MERITRKKHRRLKKSIREAIQIALIGIVGGAILVAVWIGGVIQTSERLEEAYAAEVQR